MPSGFNLNGLTRFAFCLWLLMGPNLGAAQDTLSPDYLLNSGDTIRIYVYGEPDLTFDEVLVGQNGRIAYPFIGTLMVAGRGINEIQDALIAALKPDYLIDPRVSVDIVKYRQFYLNGEVKQPGGLDFQPGLSLMKAIALVGGYTERANKKNIRVVSYTQDLSDARRVKEDYVVQPGDIITVEEGFF